MSSFPKQPLEVLQPGPGNLLYTVALKDPEQSLLAVTVQYFAPQEKITFAGGKVGEYDISQLSVTGKNGKKIAYKKQKKNKYQLLGKNRGPITLKYQVKVGGRGRHGHQGYFDLRFASFDGRIYLIPTTQAQIEAIQVRYIDRQGAPPSHRIVTPFIPTTAADTFRVYGYNKPKYLFKALKKSIAALGPFTETSQVFGETTLRVYTYAPWEERFRSYLEKHSTNLFSFFHNRLGFDAFGPFLVVWTPTSDRHRRIWSASWSNGMSYEMPFDRPNKVNRNWELFGHRVGHPMNDYAPYGMSYRDPDEHFFKEGWASYIELKAVEEAGVFDPSSRWERMYQRYLHNVSLGRDWALSQEQLIDDDDIREFIHYIKAPLVVRLLALELATNSEKNLEDFIYDIYPRYRGFNGRVPLKEELERFSGHNFGPFWERYVNSTQLILPIWRAPLKKYLSSTAQVELFDLLSTGAKITEPRAKIDNILWNLAFTRYFSNNFLQHEPQLDKNYLAEISPALQQKFFEQDIASFIDTTVMPDWRKRHKTTGDQSQILAIFQHLEAKNSDQKLDSKYIERISLGLAPVGKGKIKITQERFAFPAGPKSELATNIFWNQTAFKARYTVFKGERQLYQKVREAKNNWSYSYIKFSLAPIGQKNGIYDGPGYYRVEITLPDSKEALIGRFDFYLTEPLIRSAKAGTASNYFWHYYHLNDTDGRLDAQKVAAQVELAKTAYHAESAGRARQLPQNTVELESQLRSQTIAILQDWVEHNKLQITKSTLSGQITTIQQALQKTEKTVNPSIFRRIALLSDTYSAPTKEHLAFPAGSRITARFFFSNRQKDQFTFNLLDQNGLSVWDKIRDLKPHYMTYNMSIDTNKLPGNQVYTLVAFSKKLQQVVLKYPIYLYTR